MRCYTESTNMGTYTACAGVAFQNACFKYKTWITFKAQSGKDIGVKHGYGYRNDKVSFLY